MARFEFKLPDVGEGVAAAEIVAWHVAPGDQVEEEQPLADIMTDKATVEMESPVSGRIVELGGAIGDQIPVGSTLVVMEIDSQEAPAPSDDKSLPAAGPEEQPRKSPAPERPTRTDRIAASPAVRRRAKELGIDLATVASAGGDHIRHSDLDSYLLSRGGTEEPQPAAPRPLEEGDEVVKVVGLRRRIAAAMQEAKRRIPHFSYVEEIDVTLLEAARERLNAGSGKHLTVLPFVIEAVCNALIEFPQINATYDDAGGTITRHAAIHIGVATQTENGLVVPVIRNAQRRDLRDLASEIARLSEVARSGEIGSSELSGSTVTVTSLGKLGGIMSTPIINRPEVAIIGVNRIAERPLVVAGTIQVRKVMNLSSSFDHRVVDGWEAASFVQRIKQLLEVADFSDLSA